MSKAQQKKHGFQKGNKLGRKFRSGVNWTGNRCGHPRTSRSLTHQLRDVLEEKAASVPIAKTVAEAHGLDPRKVTVARVISVNHVGHVFDGKSGYMAELWNRIEGKQAAVIRIERDDHFAGMSDEDLVAIAKGDIPDEMLDGDVVDGGKPAKKPLKSKKRS